MRTDIINLISTTQTTDIYGDPIILETPRQVFCRLSSIGTKEFYQAAAVGMQPEMKFILADYLDYAGEKILVHESTRYKILRTYRRGQELEITAYREVNPHGDA